MASHLYRKRIQSNLHPSLLTIVDACHYGRYGLQGLLAPPPGEGEGIVAYDRVESALVAAQKSLTCIGSPEVERCLVLRLPMRPAQALQQLLYLEGAMIKQAGFQRLIVISPFETNNVIRHVLISCDVRLPVRIVSARRPVAWLSRVVLSQGTLLQEGRDELLPQMPGLVLSAPERTVLSKTLQEISIHQQARLFQRNSKTLYSQRHNALRKLGASCLLDLLCRLISMP